MSNALSADQGFSVHRQNNHLPERIDDAFVGSSDDEIWEALQSGDPNALGFIYNQNVKHLFRFGYQFTRDRELIADCIQNVFIAVGRKRSTSVKISSIKSYLFKSLYREINSKLKSNDKLSFVDPLDMQKSFAININTELRMIDEENFREKIKNAKRELNNLSEKQRQVIIHHFFDGFTYDEIAQIMGIRHKNTVAKLMKRALDTLRNCLPVILGMLYYCS